MSTTVPPTLPPGRQNKRKQPGTISADSSPKKLRVTSGPSATPSSSSQSLEPCAPLLADLQSKYEVKHMSVISSTSICKHIDKALGHLSRFSFLDDSVLPGVVLLHAKSKAASKLITIAETIRRRVAECDQKWYQYNVLYEIVSPPGLDHEPSIVEDTMLVYDSDSQGGEGNNSNGYLGPTEPTVFESATEAISVQHHAVMAIVISRVPVAELAPFCKAGVQTNADSVERKRKERFGAR
ncbi:hypothetical protein GQ53DRAFT_267292 [Thozetella sp. PMI_491]|nr:hypothetical protein GQ53DRAFT_267292 [Thozetella sp. PMI_491]